MYEDFLKLLGILLLIFALYWVYITFRKVLNFYKSLGAKVEGFIPLRATMLFGNRRFSIKWFSGLVIISDLPLTGFLWIERKWFGGGFNTFFDDKDWAETILNSSRLTKLTEAGFKHLNAVKIEGNRIKLVFTSRKIANKELWEEVRKALELTGEVIESLMGLPSSSVGLSKEKIRNWMLYYMPGGIFLLTASFCLYYFFSGYGGDTLCEDDLLGLGFKVLTPIFLVHFFMVIFILGKHIYPKVHIPILLILYFVGYYIIPLFILDPLNARFDRSDPVKIETRIMDKYWLPRRGGFRLVFEGLECSHRVSEGLYKRVNIGDKITLYVKSGAFGVRWVYRYHLRS